MAFVLFNKILSLFLIMLVGFVIVRLGMLKSEESRSLSVLSLYLICPFTILNAFQIDCTPDIRAGFILAVAAAVVYHAVIIAAMRLLKKPLKLDAVERASVIYSNAGILVIPLVTAMLGAEWVIYTCAFNAVQIILQWTHCRPLLSGDTHVDVRKLLLNINMIAIFLGVLIFFTGFRFPGPVADAMDSISAMIGPVGMLISGMLIGGMNFKEVLSFKRAWLIVALRLVVVPLLAMLALKYSGAASLVPNGQTILLITLLACSTPSGATVTQMAQVYQGDARYACSINVISTICCIATLPLIVALYMV